jgi:hypothetical protein
MVRFSISLGIRLMARITEMKMPASEMMPEPHALDQRQLFARRERGKGERQDDHGDARPSENAFRILRRSASPMVVRAITHAGAHC